MDNLRLAHKMASRDKSYYKEVQEINSFPDYYLYEIQQMLINKTYTCEPKDYTMFTKMDKGKLREIYKLPYFPHRVIQWSIMLQIQDVFLKLFIDRTYSSIPHRGIHKALKQLNYDLKYHKEDVTYCYKLDIKKYYPNIDQEILKSLLRKKFKDEDLLWLLDTIINSRGKGNGLPIGSLLSQWLGNFYLSYFDHWVLEEKKVHYYYRYADDIVLLSNSKSELHKLKNEIHNYLENNLNLTIKNTEQIFPTFVRGIDFVGYRHFGDYILLRKTTSKQFKRKMRNIAKKCDVNTDLLTYKDFCTVNSYKGWLKWCNSYNLQQKYVKPLKDSLELYYQINIKKKG